MYALVCKEYSNCIWWESVEYAMCTVDCFVPEYNAMVEVHLPVYENMDSSDIICLFQKFKDTNMQNYLWLHKIFWHCYGKCLWIQFCSHTISSYNLPCFRYMIVNYLYLSHWCKNVLSVKSYWGSSHYL